MIIKISYSINVQYFKALSDINRLMIVDMLSCGELCACKILDKFSFTQPTLSHHMKILCDSKLVISRKVGKWIYYSIDRKNAENLKAFLNDITVGKEKCICNCREESTDESV